MAFCGKLCWRRSYLNIFNSRKLLVPKSVISSRNLFQVNHRRHDRRPDVTHIHKSWLHLSYNRLAPEVVPFLLSDIGEGIGEVTVKEWYVKVGDNVRQFDSICEVQSDKASVTITSRYDGVIRHIHYEIDGIAKVGKPLVDIEIVSTNEEQMDAVLDEESDKSSNISLSAADDNKSFESTAKVLTTPAVRRLANEHNIRLTDISGTGRDGRILKEDVLTYIENSSKTSVVSTDKSVAKSVDADSDKSKTQPKPTFKVQEEASTVSDKTEPIKGIKKAMTKTMTQSLNIPHMGLGDEIDVSQLVELRAKLKNLFKDRNITLSYMPFFLKAASMALLEYPILNSSVDDKCENITYKASHNIGVAMDTKQGLLVPNIKNVQNLTILEIAEELNRLQEIGAKNLLSSEDMSNGTFTLSNIGSIGGLFGIPVILPPEVAIGALGGIKAVPKFGSDDKTIVKAHTLTVVWRADHRVIDGATICRFSSLWKQYLETPSSMLLQLK
ncbi:unnamed protein product [Oppiella nova]|uniref:Dihydrolipoamide acetyltransferase component of pyruvate dehydrogenase complex n=1 Tax=Oppiella nova TaxID=334625 RepID=A0A7R9LZN7_9ACAR|nr:unnamed protein product [Oppiella nova]CAG2168553.1 unnamed protein product [Oppiella nova]